MLQAYKEVEKRLGDEVAPDNAARLMVGMLRQEDCCNEQICGFWESLFLSQMIRKEDNGNIVSMKMLCDCMLHLSWLGLIYKLVCISLQCDAIRMMI